MEYPLESPPRRGDYPSLMKSQKLTISLEPDICLTPERKFSNSRLLRQWLLEHIKIVPRLIAGTKISLVAIAKLNSNFNYIFNLSWV